MIMGTFRYQVSLLTHLRIGSMKFRVVEFFPELFCFIIEILLNCPLSVFEKSLTTMIEKTQFDLFQAQRTAYTPRAKDL